MSAMLIIKTRAIISRIFWNVTPYAKKRERNKRTYTRRNYIWEKRLIPLPRHIVHPPIYTLRVSIRRPRNPFKTKEGTCRKNDGCNQLETRDVSALMRFTRPRMRRADFRHGIRTRRDDVTYSFIRRNTPPHILGCREFATRNGKREGENTRDKSVVNKKVNHRWKISTVFVSRFVSRIFNARTFKKIYFGSRETSRHIFIVNNYYVSVGIEEEFKFKCLKMKYKIRSRLQL